MNMNPKQISGISTAVIMLVVALLMQLNIFAYTPPDPPIPEEGVEVNLGDSELGKGDSPEPAQQKATYAPPAAEERVITQHHESTTPVKTNPNPGSVTNPVAQQQTKPEQKEPEINRNALFTGKRNQTNGSGSQGNTQTTGNQGSANGTPNTGNYNGDGGKGGVSYSLSGRSAVSLPTPKTYVGNDQGKVVVRVWVNQQGQVVRAEAGQLGTTLAKQEYYRLAEEYAKKAHFNADLNAPEEQTGTITYIFKI
jgi:hypothetical protein